MWDVLDFIGSHTERYVSTVTFMNNLKYMTIELLCQIPDEQLLDHYSLSRSKESIIFTFVLH
jgi:hypothetical protein